MKLPNTLIHSPAPLLRRSKSSAGFTLIEILVVIGIFALLSGLGLFMTLDAFRGTSFRSERDIAVSLLQKARSESMNNIGQSSHGFCFDGANYIVFDGSDCVTAAVKELTPAGSGVLFSPALPAAGIIFAQLSGSATAWSGTLQQNNKIAALSINSEGMIDW